MKIMEFWYKSFHVRFIYGYNEYLPDNRITEYHIPRGAFMVYRGKWFAIRNVYKVGENYMTDLNMNSRSNGVKTLMEY